MSMNRSLKIIYFLTPLFIIIPAIALAGQYQVVRVVDGDTIVIRFNGKYEKVRLLCVSVNLMGFQSWIGIKSFRCLKLGSPDSQLNIISPCLLGRRD